MIRSWLEIQPAPGRGLTIREPVNHETNVLRNKIWYRGDASELDQLFKLLGDDSVARARFWAAAPDKETIRKAVNQETKYARQSGGKGQYGHVKITVEPNESGKGFEFIDATVGGSVPKEYIPAVEQGIRGAMEAGVLAGFPVVDVKVTLYDGSYHEVDSSELAFKIAGSMAFKEACQKADPVILEPIMKVSIIVPDEYMGDVIGDISGRRGSVRSLEARNGAHQIDCDVPLSEMFGYATNLRSRTQGRGQFSMEPSHYVELSKNLADEVIKKRRGY